MTKRVEEIHDEEDLRSSRPDERNLEADHAINLRRTSLNNKTCGIGRFRFKRVNASKLPGWCVSEGAGI